ncbi:hypothetical protein PROFUN_02527 [Planoprotostelium fungivorum]|uniref:Uncharacterized protein n=1 Tax=Planoprotostelium fungivorum TaxID=1890364 RepID=A0A2P6MP77_9EUKA|nr:hypothetical protein PROFUN_02527 [Planoprotostelium fungivorum]
MSVIAHTTSKDFILKDMPRTVGSRIDPRRCNFVRNKSIPWKILPESIRSSDFGQMIVQVLHSIGRFATTEDILASIQRHSNFHCPSLGLKRKITSILSHKNHTDLFRRVDTFNRQGQKRALWSLHFKHCDRDETTDTQSDSSLSDECTDSDDETTEEDTGSEAEEETLAILIMMNLRHLNKRRKL